MAGQTTLFKGELIEEQLRLYFLNSGYFVARGVKYKYNGNEITDVDLFLYGRFSSMSRERSNVDIKNKKTPKAFERILWTKGLQAILGFDNSVVATTDKKENVKRFAKDNDTVLLDGSFLQKLKLNLDNRLTEEDFLKELGAIKSYDTFNNETWSIIYEKSKSMLLDELDFSGFNSSMKTLNYFFSKCFDSQKKETALRATYIIISHCLLMLDYILKDIAFLELDKRKEILSNGFKYGNLGKQGIDRTIDMAVKISGGKTSANAVKALLETDEMDVLKEFYSNMETIKKTFDLSIQFEKRAFEKQLILPEDLDTPLKGTLGVFLDFFKINRGKFFNQFPQVK